MPACNGSRRPRSTRRRSCPWRPTARGARALRPRVAAVTAPPEGMRSRVAGERRPRRGKGVRSPRRTGVTGRPQQSREETGESGSKTPGGTTTGSAATRPDGAAGSAGDPSRGGQGAPRSAGAEQVARIPSMRARRRRGHRRHRPRKGRRATPQTGRGPSAPGTTPARKPDSPVAGGAFGRCRARITGHGRRSRAGAARGTLDCRSRRPTRPCAEPDGRAGARPRRPGAPAAPAVPNRRVAALPVAGRGA